MKGILLFLVLWTATGATRPVNDYRPQKYAIFKAHTILPATLKFLVRKNGRHLFEGLERGLIVPLGQIDSRRIFRETQKITNLINRQAPFREIVAQMGYVAGLLAVYSDPSARGSRVVRDGFPYFLNTKLDRFLFVFDGYKPVALQESWLREQVAQLPESAKQYGDLLEKKYRQAGGNSRYRFSEKSAVFGVGSLYFSNLAKYSAHLWYYAWTAANGDLGALPFRESTLETKSK